MTRGSTSKKASTVEQTGESETVARNGSESETSKTNKRSVADRSSRALGNEREGTFPALEAHKANTGGKELIAVIAPELLEPLIEQLWNFDYLEERNRILNQRAETERVFTNGIERVEGTYGGPVNRALDRRQDGEQPTFNLKVYLTELDDSMQAIETLRDRIDTDYLRRSEQRYLANLESDIVAAREYLRNKRAFDEQRGTLDTEIESFEDRFDPYKGGAKYMISSEHVTLSDTARSVHRELQTMAREVDLQLLPTADADWLRDQKTRFEQLAELLPRYNEQFVERQRERYSDLFETEHGELKPSQQKAVIRNDRRNLVDASAGTGKTLTLTYRFLYLLERGVPVDDIAAVTFTNDAADEMKTRIADQVDGIQETELNISTIHTFSNRIVNRQRRQSFDIDPSTKQTELAEQFYQSAEAGKSHDEFNPVAPEAYSRFREHIDEYRKIHHERNGEPPDREYVVKKLVNFLQKATTFDLTPDDVRARSPDSDAMMSAFGHSGAELLSAYRTEATQLNGPIDFEQMIHNAVDVIREHSVELGTRYDHILVDEFQDVSEIELKLFDSFLGVGSETHLFCVGDDWQSIYGFRGSDVRIFTEFTDRFKDTTYTSLSVNFRCPPAVVDAGQKLMSLAEVNQNWKEVEADSDITTSPIIHALDLFELHGASYTADRIDDAISDGRAYDDVMVISQNDKNSAFLSDLREVLESRGVPHMRPKSQDDYIPEWYRDQLTREITFDQKGNVKYSDADEHPDLPSSPPIVTVQSIYASKGTEAPVVILAPATDGDRDGIPTKNRSGGLLEPVEANPANHLAEQRRLFYVAITRTEEEFHAIAPRGQESRFVQELSDYFESVVPGITGTCTSISEPSTKNAPYTIKLDCLSYEIKLVGWDAPEKFVKGNQYHIPNPAIERNEYGTQLRYDQCEIVQLTQEN